MRVCVGFQCESSFAAAVWSEAAIIKQLWRSTTTTMVRVSRSHTLLHSYSLRVCHFCYNTHLLNITRSVQASDHKYHHTHQMKWNISLQRSCLPFAVSLFLSFSIVMKWARTEWRIKQTEKESEKKQKPSTTNGRGKGTWGSLCEQSMARNIIPSLYA